MKNMKYETAFQRLEEITDILDSGSLTLEESLKLFAEATELTAFCTRCLEQAKLKITELTDKQEEDDDAVSE